MPISFPVWKLGYLVIIILIFSRVTFGVLCLSFLVFIPFSSKAYMSLVLYS